MGVKLLTKMMEVKEMFINAVEENLKQECVLKSTPVVATINEILLHLLPSTVLQVQISCY